MDHAIVRRREYGRGVRIRRMLSRMEIFRASGIYSQLLLIIFRHRIFSGARSHQRSVDWEYRWRRGHGNVTAKNGKEEMNGTGCIDFMGRGIDGVSSPKSVSGSVWLTYSIS